MADNNNAIWDKLPETPDLALKKLDRLVGKWKISGPKIDGYTTYEWMEGGFFLIQHFDLTSDGERHTGIEYTGFDEDTRTPRSRLMEINGGNFTYTYEIEGDTFWYWFGNKGSDNYSRGIFSKDGNTITGRWQWPESEGKTGGYEYTMTRVKEQSGREINTQKIIPFLWFDDKAEEAMNFYTSIFENSKVLSIMRYREAGPGPERTVMSATFQLEGQEFIALNGGPQFTFSPAISFFVNCETQEEVDELWEKLSEGGEKQGPGWLKDKYGLSWQIVPTVLGDLLNDPDPIKSQRVMEAMLQMDKIDIKTLRQAYNQQ
jgi:predicted 3-demethylubiquinone-9 3-methyltransferase (glyoxalase superfamily)